ncbi:MAG: DUF2382 domain-containing protein [Chloroflexaceae bacterium]|nr:DUF2382 domain-containing protein [Chloroflexaceae bacterium]
MALYRIADFNPQYRQDAFEGKDVKGFEVYTERNEEKIGTVDDILVDQNGRFRYLAIDSGNWMSGKRMLLPVGRAKVDRNRDRVFAIGLHNRRQVEQLPEYRDAASINRTHEEQVRQVYRTVALEDSTSVEASLPVEMGELDAVRQTSRPTPRPAIAEPVTPAPMPQPAPEPVEAPAYDYEREPDLYTIPADQQTLRLYEERLIASKERHKAGEVTVGKHVETQTARVEVPVEKERVIVERHAPAAGQVVTPGPHDFQSGEVARMDVYEETADIHKEAVVREEVNVRKEVVQDRVETTETLRREELDVDIQGQSTSQSTPQPTVDNPQSKRPRRRS